MVPATTQQWGPVDMMNGRTVQSDYTPRSLLSLEQRFAAVLYPCEHQVAPKVAQRAEGAAKNEVKTTFLSVRLRIHTLSGGYRVPRIISARTPEA